MRIILFSRNVVLVQCSRSGPCCGNPSSSSKFRAHIISLVPACVPMYSNSVRIGGDRFDEAIINYGTLSLTSNTNGLSLVVTRNSAN